MSLLGRPAAVFFGDTRPLEGLNDYGTAVATALGIRRLCHRASGGIAGLTFPLARSWRNITSRGSPLAARKRAKLFSPGRVASPRRLYHQESLL